MMTMPANETKMKYALYLGSVDVVATDYNGNPQYYSDSEGNVIYIVTGKKRDIYSEPMDFDANFSTSGGEAQEQEYGLDISQYDGIALYAKGAYPIVEGALIWVKSEIEYTDKGYYTQDMQTLIQVNSPVKTSADYVCKKVSDSLSFTKAIFTAINK